MAANEIEQVRRRGHRLELRNQSDDLKIFVELHVCKLFVRVNLKHDRPLSLVKQVEVTQNTLLGGLPRLSLLVKEDVVKIVYLESSAFGLDLDLTELYLDLFHLLGFLL